MIHAQSVRTAHAEVSELLFWNLFIRTTHAEVAKSGQMRRTQKVFAQQRKTECAKLKTRLRNPVP